MNQQKSKINEQKPSFVALLWLCFMLPLLALPAAANPGLGSLPQYVGLGVIRQDGDTWPGLSGVPWDYVYTYVNPGWKTADGNNFIQNYIAYNNAHRYITIFTWYELSNGWYRTGGGLNCADASMTTMFNNCINLQSKMSIYYNDFILFLQRITAGNPTKSVIIHMDPDWWGFLQQQDCCGGNRTDATKVAISVASAGITCPSPGSGNCLSAYANNAAGYARAVHHLRDIYAPNVILAFHASLWAPNNGYAPQNGADPNAYNGSTTTGNELATWYNSMAQPFDLVFFDTSDMDAGFYIKNCPQNNPIRGYWTTAAANDYKNLMGVFSTNAGNVKTALWQTPEGNTLYDTLNNQPNANGHGGHYMDNRPEYFIKSSNVPANIQGWRDTAHLAFILFGYGQQHPYSQCNGNRDATAHWDNEADGVTNPAPVCPGDSACFSGAPANNLTATVADDDGGFIRSASAAYYAGGPVPWEGSPPPPPPHPSTVTVEDSNSAIIYSGTWGSASDSNDSGGGEHYSNSNNASAQFSFVGTSIEWLGKKGPNYGIAKVYLDGVSDATVDTYAASGPFGVFQQNNYSRSGLANTSHTIKIDVTNMKNAASSNYYQVIDAFIYSSKP